MKINEIFVSPQGEGEFAGENHLFIRFPGCNLNCCYCDTDFKKYDVISFNDLNKEINSIYSKMCFSKIALTGGEPLIHADDIIKLRELDICVPFMLETNSTLTSCLRKVVDTIDYYSLDFKLEYHLDEYDFFEFFNVLMF